MVGKSAGGTNTLHAMGMAAVVVVSAFVVGYVVFDLQVSLLPEKTQPDASFGFTYDEEAAGLEVTHLGGDTLDAERIVFLNGSYQQVGSWAGDSDGVTAGESTTVSDVGENDTVYVMWVNGDGDYVRLDTWNAQGTATDGSETTTHGTETVTDGTETAAGANEAERRPRTNGDRHLFASD